MSRYDKWFSISSWAWIVAIKATLHAVKSARFKLAKGDSIFVYSKHRSYEAKVAGFYSYGMYLEDIGVLPFNKYSFYGSGYTSLGSRFIYVKSRSHYKWAIAFEWVRLNLSPYFNKIF